MEIKEKILNYISSIEYNKENIDELSFSLNIDALEFKNFVKAINELEEEGILYITSKGFIHLAQKVNIFLGKVKSLKKYSAIIELNDGNRVVVYNEHLKNAYLNDKVRVHVNQDMTAEVMDILSHSLWELVAIYHNHEFVVEERNFPYELKVKSFKNHFHLVEGHIVKLKVLKYDEFILNCEVIEILGHKNDPGMDVLKTIVKSEVPYQFDKKLLEYTDKIIQNAQIDNELSCRKDMTKEMIVTIDGLDAKDLDDAISLTINDEGHFLLGVHIADVSYFVQEDSMLDKEAFTRGTSIYLADRVIPMLPHALSNGICSLNQDEIRLTMSCMMEIDEEGKVIDYEITPSYIKSSARLDYEDVNRLFQNKPTRLDYSKDMKQMLFLMKRLSQILSKRSERQGYIQLNVDEAKLIMDSKKNKVISIEKRVSGEAEKLIENFMILANETVASHIFYMQLPFIYRVHAPISEEKRSYLLENLKEMNLGIHSKQTSLSSRQIQEILKKVKDTSLEYVINNWILRSMSKAYYDVNNIGHFGLGSECYTHFTSPIRRYPDLIVHRFLKKYLVENDFKDQSEFLIQAAENSSVTERKALSLEREVEDMKKAEYMNQFIGCIYDGIVTGIVDFGLFVKLDNTCEGLMRYETIPGAFSYNLSFYQKKFKIGNILKVKVISTNVSNGEINFAYIAHETKIQQGGQKNVKTRHK